MKMKTKHMLGMGAGLAMMALAGIASAQPPTGPGAGQYGYGPGMMQGYGGMGPGMMRGYGGGPGMMGGYGMGPGRMGGYGGMGPGMMGYGGHGYGPGMGFGGGYGPGARGGYGALDLGLTDAQRQKMEAISGKLWDEQEKTAIKLHDRMVELNRLYNAKDPDTKAIEKRYDDISSLRKEMFEQRLRAWKEWRAVLTDEQRKKIESRRGW